MVVDTYSNVHVLEMEEATDDVPYTVYCAYTNNNHDCYIQFQIIKNKCAAGIYVPIFQFVNCTIFFMYSHAAVFWQHTPVHIVVGSTIQFTYIY